MIVTGVCHVKGSNECCLQLEPRWLWQHFGVGRELDAENRVLRGA
jgi:hypothetical protein